MLGSIEALCSNTPIRALLTHYRKLHQSKPGAGESSPDSWHDRFAHFPGLDERQLSAVYGTLLAYGWLETRVLAECFDPLGEVRQAYQITREGLRALKATEDRFGNLTFVPPDETDVWPETGNPN